MVTQIDRGLRARQVRRFSEHLQKCPDHKCTKYLTPKLLAHVNTLIEHYGKPQTMAEIRWPRSWDKKASALFCSIRHFSQWVADIKSTAGGPAKDNAPKSKRYGKPRPISAQASSRDEPDELGED